MGTIEQPPPRPAATTWAVIVTWNSDDCLPEALRLLGAARPAPGVVVVDNASTDRTVARLRQEFPAATVLANPDNRGFAAATNQGVRQALQAGAARILLLNPDARLAPPDLARLETALDAEPRLGLLAPALREANGRPQPFAFGDDPTLGVLLRRGARRLLRRAPSQDWGSTTVLHPDWITGACLLARREVFEQGFWLDERFFLYFEDNDWCLRVRRDGGWRIGRLPDAQAVHLGGQSLRRNPAAQRAYAESLVRFYAKHYPRWQGWLVRRLWPLYARAASC